MANNFDELMSTRTDSELLKIVSSPEGDYQQLALEAAKKELATRNLSADQVSNAKQEIEVEQKVKAEKANVPLDTGWKILTLIFPGVLQLFFSRAFISEGHDRKAKELVQWTFYGFGIYGGIIFLIILLETVF